MDPTRDWLFIACERGHDMQSTGGCNAGCDPDCGCSVPVHRCTRCGDCDYGENPEAIEIRQACAFRRITEQDAQDEMSTPLGQSHRYESNEDV